jgi:hypothetical protein
MKPYLSILDVVHFLEQVDDGNHERGVPSDVHPSRRLIAATSSILGSSEVCSRFPIAVMFWR